MKLKTLLAALGLTLVAGAAIAGGIYTNGLPAAPYPLVGTETYGGDTNLPAGINPQTESVSTSQIAVFAPAPVALTDGATIALDKSLSNLYTVTLAGNRTLANPTNLVSGQTWKVIVKQDGTGSRTLAYGTLYYWPCNSSNTCYAGAPQTNGNGIAPTLSTSSGYVDVLTFLYNGNSILSTSSLGTP